MSLRSRMWITLVASTVLLLSALALSISSSSSSQVPAVTRVVEASALQAADVGTATATPGPVPTTTPSTTTTVPASTVPPTTAPPTTAPPTTAPAAPATVAPSPSPSGECGGWRDLIATYFPGEVDTACRVFIGCESGGNPNAVSRTGDHGLAQINAATWNRPGHADPVADWIGRHWASVYDPATNLEMASRIRDAYGWAQWSCF